MSVTDRGDEGSLPDRRTVRDVIETGITAVATDTDTLDRPVVRDHRELRDMTTGGAVVTGAVVTGSATRTVVTLSIETLRLLSLEINGKSLEIDRRELQTIILQTKIPTL